MFSWHNIEITNVFYASYLSASTFDGLFLSPIQWKAAVCTSAVRKCFSASDKNCEYLILGLIDCQISRNPRVMAGNSSSDSGVMSLPDSSQNQPPNNCKQLTSGFCGVCEEFKLPDLYRCSSCYDASNNERNDIVAT